MYVGYDYAIYIIIYNVGRVTVVILIISSRVHEVVIS